MSAKLNNLPLQRKTMLTGGGGCGRGGDESGGHDNDDNDGCDGDDVDDDYGDLGQNISNECRTYISSK